MLLLLDVLFSLLLWYLLSDLICTFALIENEWMTSMLLHLLTNEAGVII